MFLFTQTNIMNKKFHNKNDRLRFFYSLSRLTVSVFFIRKISGTPCRIFQRYYPSTVMSAAMQNLHRLFILNFLKAVCLNLTSPAGGSKENSWTFFISFEPRCISNHRIIKQNMNWGYFNCRIARYTCVVKCLHSIFKIVYVFEKR